VSQSRPVEEVIHDSLVLRNQLVKLIHEHYTRDTTRTRVTELSLQEIKSLSWTGSFPLKSLPEKSI
jgi:hypothetical protein